MGHPMIRGIANTSSQTACHISSALQLLFHAIDDDDDHRLREAILHYDHRNARQNEDSNFLSILKEIFELLLENTTDDDDDNPIANAESLYQRLSDCFVVKGEDDRILLDASRTGDTVTTFARLLQKLKETLDDSESTTTSYNISAFESIFEGGSTQSTLERRSSNEISSSDILEIKVLPTRRMNYPLTLTIPDYSTKEWTLAELLDHHYNQPHILKDYRWNKQSQQMDGSVTFKRTEIVSLPKLWFIHLNRYSNTTGTYETKRISVPVDIPSRLDTSFLFRNRVTSTPIEESELPHEEQPRCTYELVGAVIYEDDNDDTDSLHSLVAIKRDDEWYLIDDDEVDETTTGNVLSILKGSSLQQGASSDSNQYGILFMYKYDLSRSK